MELWRPSNNLKFDSFNVVVLKAEEIYLGVNARVKRAKHAERDLLAFRAKLRAVRAKPRAVHALERMEFGPCVE